MLFTDLINMPILYYVIGMMTPIRNKMQKSMKIVSEGKKNVVPGA